MRATKPMVADKPMATRAPVDMPGSAPLALAASRAARAVLSEGRSAGAMGGTEDVVAAPDKLAVGDGVVADIPLSAAAGTGERSLRRVDAMVGPNVSTGEDMVRLILAWRRKCFVTQSG